MRRRKIIHGVLLLSLLMIVVACTQEKKQIAFGPYLQNMTSESVVICWTTQEGESKVVAPDSSVKIIRHYQTHEMPLVRLKSEATYHYDILGDGSPEGKGSFTTSATPPPGSRRRSCKATISARTALPCRCRRRAWRSLTCSSLRRQSGSARERQVRSGGMAAREASPTPARALPPT